MIHTYRQVFRLFVKHDALQFPCHLFTSLVETFSEYPHLFPLSLKYNNYLHIIKIDTKLWTKACLKSNVAIGKNSPCCYFTFDRFFFTPDGATISCSTKQGFLQQQIKFSKFQQNLWWWPTVCNFTKINCFTDFLRASLNCQNSYFVEQAFGGCFCYQIKIADIMNAVLNQTPSRQFSILVNDSNLREINSHETPENKSYRANDYSTQDPLF